MAISTAETPVVHSRRFTRRADLLNLLLISVFCGLATWLRWVKLNSLVHDDPAMWLFQISRAANGELPYRDFSWNYPPLAVFSFAWAWRWLGISFASAQVIIDILSLAVVALSYWLLRYLLPRSLHVPVILLLIAIGATAQTKFTLFSLLTYSPSLHWATIGLLLLMIGCLRYWRSGSLDALNRSLIISGALISELSKPESLLAAIFLLAVLALLDRKRAQWTRQYAGLLAAAIFPAVAIYVAVALWVGPANFKDGLSGYGLATFACPWWPTGLGLFGALAASGEAVAIAALLALALHADANLLRRLRIPAVAGLGLYLAYAWYLNREAVFAPRTLLQKGQLILPTLVWTSPILLPVMWASILLWCWFVTRPAHTSAYATLILVLTVPVVMSSRSLFGTTLFPYSEVSAVCYPFFILVGPYLLWRLAAAIQRDGPRAAWLIGALACGYSLLRIAGGYSLLSDRPYTTLVTSAGAVRLAGNDGSADIYRYVMEHTQPSDWVLDIPYGGGVNLASGRRSPAFTSEFNQLRMPERFQQMDRDGVARNRPKVVIADDAPEYGTSFGWIANMKCPCPRLVWEPDEPSWDAGHKFPLVEYLQQNYRVERKIGDKLILVPK
jgi:hypothetical protein